jgi:hypothetical protein
MLKARDASIPEMCANTPGWFITSAERTCFMTAIHLLVKPHRQGIQRRQAMRKGGSSLRV